MMQICIDNILGTSNIYPSDVFKAPFFRNLVGICKEDEDDNILANMILDYILGSCLDYASFDELANSWTAAKLPATVFSNPVKVAYASNLETLLRYIHPKTTYTIQVNLLDDMSAIEDSQLENVITDVTRDNYIELLEFNDAFDYGVTMDSDIQLVITSDIDNTSVAVSVFTDIHDLYVLQGYIQCIYWESDVYKKVPYAILGEQPNMLSLDVQYIDDKQVLAPYIGNLGISTDEERIVVDLPLYDCATIVQLDAYKDNTLSFIDGDALGFYLIDSDDKILLRQTVENLLK